MRLRRWRARCLLIRTSTRPASRAWVVRSRTRWWCSRPRCARGRGGGRHHGCGHRPRRLDVHVPDWIARTVARGGQRPPPELLHRSDRGHGCAVRGIHRGQRAHFRTTVRVLVEQLVRAMRNARFQRLTSLALGATAVAGSLPKCVGGYPGLFDMSGNVNEWEDSCAGSLGSSDACLLRGGAYDDGFASGLLGCCLAANAHNLRSAADPTVGFRCCSP